MSITDQFADWEGRALKRLFAGLTWLTEKLVVLLIFTMTILVLLQVVLRYVFGTGVSWSEEVSRYLLVAITFLGAGLGVRRNRHVSVQVFVQMMSPRVQAVVKRIVELAVLFFILVFIRSSFDLFSRFHVQRAPASRISMGWPHGSMVVGGVLMLVQLLARVWHELDHGTTLKSEVGGEDI
ncbi:MAG: TRAP transporter small permease [Firmicutes bacterium]|nr:TRAP transporter small permease [Bacillota bacterium]